MKLRREVDGLNGEQPTFEQIKDMKYLKYVINESTSPSQSIRVIWGTSCEHGLNGSLTNFTALRLHPVVPLNARMSIADTVLPRGGGPDGSSPIFIPAKTPVGWNLYAMHRREDLFGKDAEDFRPERWETLRAGWEYLPFNGGPRICIGRK